MGPSAVLSCVSLIRGVECTLTMGNRVRFLGIDNLTRSSEWTLRRVGEVNALRGVGCIPSYGRYTAQVVRVKLPD